MLYMYTCSYKSLVGVQICSSFLHKLHVYIVDLQFLNIWAKDAKVLHKITNTFYSDDTCILYI